MQHTRVSSTNVSSVGYDASSSTLEVTFHSGDTYQYYGVPASVHAGLMRASSKGSYLASYVKGRYQYRQVR